MVDGNIAYYAHLKSIQSDLYLGKKVLRGSELGLVGISGVPDRDYQDSHLHFEISKNPFTSTQYSLENTLFWPYLGK